MPDFILASASPRRRRLLAEAGLDFECHESDVDESPFGFESPHVLATRLALTKALAAARREPKGLEKPRSARGRGDLPILAADTLVITRAGEVLGKAKDRDEAARMLDKLCLEPHFVTTGVALWNPDGRCFLASDTSQLRFRPGPYDAYLDSGQWRGKAGAYGVQDALAPAVLEQGRLDTVIGLPVDLSVALLARVGVFPKKHPAEAVS